MPYNSQDKYDFAIKDAKYSIGQALGNAFSKAVDVIICEHSKDEIDGKNVIGEIIRLRDLFFEENQKKLEEEQNKWIAENDHKIKLEVGLEVPTVYEGTDIDV